MSGKELKDILYKNNLSQSEIARQLGMSQQSFSQMLSASDVKSSLLERISEVIGVKMSFFYPEASGTQTAASGDGSVVKVETRGDYSPASVNGDASVEVKGAPAAVLEERVKSLQALVEEKERTIRILMEGRK